MGAPGRESAPGLQLSGGLAGMTRRRIIGLGALLGLLHGFLIGGCTGTAAPTLPLPPPVAVSSAPDAEGIVTIEGSGAIEEAFVFAYNPRRAAGVIGTADAQGEFELNIRADSGDALQVWQRFEGESSGFVDLVVPDP